MTRDPTTARLTVGRLVRLGARRSRDADTPAGAAQAAVPAAARDVAPEGPRGLAGVPRLVAILARHGHEVRVTDRTEPGEVPAATQREAYRVLEDVVTVLVRCAASDQRISLRIRTEDDALLLSVQTLPAGARPKPIVLTARDEDLLRRRVEGAAGRATVRTTHGGNWIAMARLPLRA